MPLVPSGRDVWRMACHRSLDAPTADDWTFRIARAPDSKVLDIMVGCWLARNVASGRWAALDVMAWQELARHAE